MGSVVVVHRRTYNTTVVVLPHGMWDLPRPGIKPMSPALTDKFLSIAPPEKSQAFFALDGNQPLVLPEFKNSKS